MSKGTFVQNLRKTYLIFLPRPRYSARPLGERRLGERQWGTCALRHRGRRGRESQCKALKHAWVLAWVASRFAASSCALRFSHFAIVLLFSWTNFYTKAKS